MSVTTKELAEICNVSRRTVTRALSGNGRISEKTKQMILAKAQELEYEPDLLARSLVKGRSMSIGVVLCDLKNMYFPKAINAMEAVAREEDYVLNIMLHDNDKEIEKEIIRRLNGHKVDGLILDPACNDISNYTYLKKYSFPTLVVGGMPLDGYPYVGNNEFEAGKDAACEIADKGYQLLYFVFPEMDKQGTSFGGHMERLNGIKAAAEEKGIECKILGSSNYLDEALRIIETEKKKVAFLCSGDIYAAYIMMKLAEAGFTAGFDYGIMGFDNLDIMEMFSRKLTTVENNIESFGRTTMEFLIRMIKKQESASTIYIPHNIVKGETL